MLHSLHVRNLAIVENSRVEFAPGLNVITGETGAGKSILIGALDLVLGGRADKTLIRSGENQCRVEAAFQLADPAAVDAILDELGLDPCADGQLVIRRIVSAGGSGRNFVNDSATTAQVLKRIGNQLVDMHGPHDHQSLLRQESQLDILDAFGHVWKRRDAYERQYRELIALQARLKELQTDDEDVAERIDMLSFQVKEIEDAKLTDDDEGELEQEHARVANAQRILELADGVERGLTGDDAAAFNSMVFVQNALAEMEGFDDGAGEWLAEARSVAVQIQELSSSISAYAQSVEADPGRLQWLEDRMALLQKLKRKYGGSVTEVRQFLARAREKLRDLETRHERIAEIAAEIAAVQASARKAGKALGKARRKAAGDMARQITTELRDLGFAHGAFDVALTETAPGPAGMDEIEFGFMPNVGEPMRPLRAIASSGEISRVMLATKSVLAKHDRIPVLVFDEIDANVGGEIGNAVGAKLATVAGSHQVLCITHLPQVAVHGATHFVVEKGVSGGRTHTQIRCLAGDERAGEVARMLGGRELTSVTLEHAREMLANRSTAP
jgi:DNA repair protein RecN (Recombination protein N)